MIALEHCGDDRVVLGMSDLRSHLGREDNEETQGGLIPWLAEVEFQRAIELDPSCATAHYWYALHRMRMKKQDALEHIQRARELDPVSMVIGSIVGLILLNTREYDRSIETLRETLELDRSFAGAQDNLASAYTANGISATQEISRPEGALRRSPVDPIPRGRRS